jgi:hypothetical protein
MRVNNLPFFRPALVGVIVALLSLSGCTADADPQSAQDELLRMNEIQVLGTHNSYHIQPRDSILEALAIFTDQATADSLEYTALPLKEQFDHGVRQIELDIFADPEGGLYAIRRGLSVVGDEPVSGIPELDEPGLKVLHTQDLDFETHCLTFQACLTSLKEWSDANPDHVPITVMVEAKEEAIDNALAETLGFTIPLEFGPEELAALDDEILAVFPAAQLITPDDVRGERDTLEEAVLDVGWLTLAEARGRVMFAFLNRSAARNHYIDGHPSLRGRVMFTNSVRGEPEAGWFNVNNALNDGEEIRELVAAGYLVRTRADEPTQHARDGDTSLQEAAFASGGQFVSTDYVVPNPDFGTDYSAAVPGGYVARCNPISAPTDCDSDLIRP